MSGNFYGNIMGLRKNRSCKETPRSGMQQPGSKRKYPLMQTHYFFDDSTQSPAFEPEFFISPLRQADRCPFSRNGIPEIFIKNTVLIMNPIKNSSGCRGCAPSEGNWQGICSNSGVENSRVSFFYGAPPGGLPAIDGASSISSTPIP